MAGYNPWNHKESDATERLTLTNTKNKVIPRHLTYCYYLTFKRTLKGLSYFELKVNAFIILEFVGLERQNAAA